MDCLRKRFNRFNRFYRFSGGGAAHKNIEAPRSIHNGDAQRLAFQSLATHPCFQTSNGMKKSGKMRLKQAINESTLSTAGAVPLPQWGRQRGGGFAAKNEANPASLRSAAPSKGRGSRGHSLLPMEGGAPKGRRLNGESGIFVSQPSPLGEGAP